MSRITWRSTPAVTSSEYGQSKPSALAYLTDSCGNPLHCACWISPGCAMPSLFGSVHGQVWNALVNGLTFVTRSIPTCRP